MNDETGEWTETQQRVQRLVAVPPMALVLLSAAGEDGLQKHASHPSNEMQLRLADLFDMQVSSTTSLHAVSSIVEDSSSGFLD